MAPEHQDVWKNPDQRWSIFVQHASLALPGYYYLGECFFHISLHKRLWYPKIEAFFGAFPPQRRSLRKTSPKTRAQIRNLLKRGGDLAALGPAEFCFWTEGIYVPFTARSTGKRTINHGIWGNLVFGQSPKINQRARAPLSSQPYQQWNKTLLRATLTWSFHCESSQERR